MTKVNAHRFTDFPRTITKAVSYTHLALKRYTEAVRLKPDYADAYMNMGSCYGVAGQYDQALVYLEKAVFYDPKLSQAYYMIGVTWKNKGNEQMANQYFQKAEMAKARK